MAPYTEYTYGSIFKGPSEKNSSQAVDYQVEKSDQTKRKRPSNTDSQDLSPEMTPPKQQ